MTAGEQVEVRMAGLQRVLGYLARSESAVLVRVAWWELVEPGSMEAILIWVRQQLGGER